MDLNCLESINYGTFGWLMEGWRGSPKVLALAWEVVWNRVDRQAHRPLKDQSLN